MRARRTTVLSLTCAATALVALTMLAVSPATSPTGADPAAGRANSALAAVVTDRCDSRAGTPVTDGVASIESSRPAETGDQVATRADGAIVGTSADDLAGFATAFNSLRAEACADVIPLANFRIDPCLEERLFWIAEDPSTDPGSAWRGRGAVRSDGVAETGCAGSLAGGDGDTPSSVAAKWWASPAHRLVLFRLDAAADPADSCVDFAMVHGGVPNETHDFARAAARWRDC